MTMTFSLLKAPCFLLGPYCLFSPSRGLLLTHKSLPCSKSRMAPTCFGEANVLTVTQSALYTAISSYMSVACLTFSPSLGSSHKELPAVSQQARHRQSQGFCIFFFSAPKVPQLPPRICGIRTHSLTFSGLECKRLSETLPYSPN